MADQNKIDLSKLTPDQSKQLEQLLTNLVSSAKASSAERPADMMSGEGYTHDNHESAMPEPPPDHDGPRP